MDNDHLKNQPKSKRKRKEKKHEQNKKQKKFHAYGFRDDGSEHDDTDKNIQKQNGN